MGVCFHWFDHPGLFSSQWFEFGAVMVWSRALDLSMLLLKSSCCWSLG